MSGAERAERPTGPPGFVAALAAAVALPVLVTGMRVVRSGWIPAIDDGTISTRAYDVWSRHPPLVGQFSLATTDIDQAAHSPGPMLYWLVSLPARSGWPGAIPLTMAVLNAVLLAACVWLAHRRGGPWLAAAMAVGLACLVRAFGPATLVEVWNPWAALVPFTTLAIVAWCVADGDRFLLPPAVLLASFCMQSHLTYVVPSFALLAVAVLGGWVFADVTEVARRADGGARSALDPPAGSRRRPSTRRHRLTPFAAAILVGLACWVVPLYEQATRHPGNMTLLLRSNQGTGERAGLEAGWSSLGRAIGVPPRWSRGEPDPATEITEGLAAASAVQTLVTVLALAALVGATVVAFRKRDRTMVRLAAVVSVLVGALVVVGASLPIRNALVAGYTFRWFALAGLLAWLLVGTVVMRHLVPARGRSESDTPASPALRWLPLALAVAVALFGLLVPVRDSAAWSYRPARDVGDVILDATERGGVYLIAQPGRYDIAFTPAIAWRLRTSGRQPVVLNPHAEAFGEQYAVQGNRRCSGLILLDEPGAPVARGAKVVGTVAIPNGPDLPPTVRVSLMADMSPAGRC